VALGGHRRDDRGRRGGHRGPPDRPQVGRP
jgi:hypothetical protein